jgi:hypothetical protein
MGSRSDVVLAANAESTVTWYTDTPRILEYFYVSTGVRWTRDNALKISWCTYFAHWVLVKAGITPLPAVGTSDKLKSVGGSVGRFLHYTTDGLKKTGHAGNGVYSFHDVKTGGYQPKAGDLYYRSAQNYGNHVGVIVGVNGNQIYTVDGNGGPHGGDARFFIDWSKKPYVQAIGKGFVDKPGAPKTLGAGDFYIEIPD